ncbi:unnamed protein product [Anisakis simplex]|uniref:RNA-binding protein 34 (inferred by orthology to a human protein) n=1 Tax=Anisakis simplex TaxID=6269 RepID=A0A0M3JVA2_ANISI|nr:unnamed protein product [Anisakis simplex]
MNGAEYVPGALTTLLSGGCADIEPNDSTDPKRSSKKRKGTKRKKAPNSIDDSDETPSNTASSLFDKSDSNVKIPEMPVGSALIEPKKPKLEEERTEERANKKLKGRETQRLNNRTLKAKQTEEEQERTVFVGNVPKSETRKTIKKLFSKYGTVESVRLRSVVSGSEKTSKKVAVLKHDFSSKMQSLIFYVKFTEADSAKEALAMNGELLKEHKLRVDSCAAKKNYNSKTTVFVGNVPFDTQEDLLRGYFEKCGEVEFVRIVRDSSTGIGKGFAFVSFKDSATVPIAIKMSGSTFNKRELRVTRIQKKNKVTS